MLEDNKKTIKFEIQIKYGPFNKVILKVIRYYMYDWSTIEELMGQEILTIGQLAKAIKLSDKNLIDMLAEFHGTTYNSKQYPAISFRKMADAQEAKEWLESLLMMHTLIKEE